jgi:PAS domain-containing protein
MNLIDAIAGATPGTALAGTLGLRRWLFDLSEINMHLETTGQDDKTAVNSFNITALESQYEASELTAILGHIEAAARKGRAGPEVLTLSPDGSRKFKVMSVSETVRHNGKAYILGVYRMQESDAALMRRLTLLSDYLDAFIQNSPSCILVINNGGKVLNANPALAAFLRQTNHRAMIGHSIAEISPMFDDKLVAIIKASLLAPIASKGRHIINHGTGLVQSIYWRCFPLSLKEDPSGTRVFAFDPSAAGPTDKIL